MDSLTTVMSAPNQTTQVCTAPLLSTIFSFSIANKLTKPLTLTASLCQTTVSDIDAGVYGDPNAWSFGTPEPNHYDRAKILRDTLEDPYFSAFLNLQTPEERARQLQQLEAQINRMDTFVFGVSSKQINGFRQRHLTNGDPFTGTSHVDELFYSLYAYRGSSRFWQDLVHSSLVDWKTPGLLL